MNTHEAYYKAVSASDHQREHTHNVLEETQSVSKSIASDLEDAQGKLCLCEAAVHERPDVAAFPERTETPDITE